MSDVQPPAPERRFDLIATIVFGVAGALWAGSVVFWLQPSFHRLFLDFSAALPRLTEAFLSPVVVSVGAALPCAVAALPLVPGVPRDLRPLTMGAAVLLALAQPFAFFSAMYLPMMALAGAVR